MRQLPYFLALFFCLSSSILYAQLVFNVPGDYDSIQAALDASEEGTKIFIAEGIYYEHLEWSGDVSGIELIGAGSDLTILDGQGTGRVVKIIGSFSGGDENQPSFRLSGLTVQNGYVNDDDGAGLQTRSVDGIIEDVVFRDNKADGGATWGGAVELNDFGGEIKNCAFLENQINTTSRAYGGGLNVEVREHVIIEQCEFIDNEANTLQWAYGGALYVDESLSFGDEIVNSINIRKCRFENNSTSTDSWSYGGALYLSRMDAEVSIDSCEFVANKTGFSNWSTGGAIHSNAANVEINSSTFWENESEDCTIQMETSSNENSFQISNSTFYNNSNGISSSNWSSVFRIDPFDNIEVKFENCLVFNNDLAVLNAITFFDEIDIEVNHCTFFNNEKGVDLDAVTFKAFNSVFWNGGEEIEDNAWIGETESEIEVGNCIVQGGYDGENVIDADPLFFDNSILIPSPDSPCLNGGILSDVTEDILGNSRPMPVNSRPDIGAYEIDQYFAHVHIEFFLDLNENGTKESDEPFASMGSILVNEKSLITNYDDDGIFLIAPQGVMNVKYDATVDPLWEVSGQDEFTFDVNSEDFAGFALIGLTSTADLVDVQTLINNDNFRCGEEVDFQLTLKNRGTVTASGIAWIIIDDRIDDYEFSIEPDYVNGDNYVGWDFENLFPGDCLDIEFTVTAPLIETAEEVGTLYCFIGSLDIENNNRPNRFEHKVELRCAFDPNDKNVSPYRADSLALVEADLIYKIRFQNTGNDYARNVIVRDTLSEDLDMSTFELISTSHPDQLQVSISNERAIKFEFLGIYLPDSLSNEPDSHGYIDFSIRPYQDVDLNTNITNTAHIYFDFNPAIVTNTTQSIMVDAFPTSSTDDLDLVKIESFPQPASSVVYLSKRVDGIKVYNEQGQLIKSVGSTEVVSVTELVNGIYFVEYMLEGQIVNDRWVVAR